MSKNPPVAGKHYCEATLHASYDGLVEKERVLCGRRAVARWGKTWLCREHYDTLSEELA